VIVGLNVMRDGGAGWERRVGWSERCVLRSQVQDYVLFTLR
jgi:hypothetical protein